ncbi:hypothetical protein FN846DRAFT_903664 [Sphaerosporella brunnea]|uniref:Protein SYM1 n=1 Tax=Sphaerosporella brunnea TaxID=1250544 RepID=A0A5J5F6B3_9PEZI|nr:hypothetical protein FN846DRAFT_903664 [Sphaerosporella brunnea]
MASVFRAYQKLLTKRPIFGGAVTSAALFGLGDVISQQGIERKGIKDHNFAATARMTIYGGCVFGPAAVGWYKVLEKFVVFKKHSNLQTAARVALDQLVFAPIGIGAFFSAMTVMEGGDVKHKLDNNWWNALKANWNIWPAVQLVNFTFVPFSLRIVVVNVISVGWNSYLAYLNTKKEDDVVDGSSKEEA